MRITIESTDLIVTVNESVQARVWEGATRRGTKVMVLIALIGTGIQESEFFEIESHEEPPRMASKMAHEIFPDEGVDVPCRTKQFPANGLGKPDRNH